MNTLREHLKSLAPLVSNAIVYSADALINNDEALARRVRAEDSRLNRLRTGIEEATYALVDAGNLDPRSLRFSVSTVVVSHSLVQIGDNAANVAHLALQIMGSGKSELLPAFRAEFSDMVYNAAEMVNDAVRAFVDMDARLAESTVRRDRELNDAFELMTSFLTPEYDTPERRMLLLWTVNNIQQMGTYAASICERAIFVVTGEMKEFH